MFWQITFLMHFFFSKTKFGVEKILVVKFLLVITVTYVTTVTTVIIFTTFTTVTSVTTVTNMTTMQYVGFSYHLILKRLLCRKGLNRRTDRPTQRLEIYSCSGQLKIPSLLEIFTMAPTLVGHGHVATH